MMAVALLASGPHAWAQVKAGGEFQLTADTAYYPRRPRIARHRDGSLVAVWQESSVDDTSFWLVKGQRFDRAGNRVGAEFIVNTWVNGGGPAVAPGRNGDFVVVWTQSLPHIYSGRVHGRRFDANANPLGVEFEMNTYTTGIQFSPNVAMDDQGNFVVAWTSATLSGSKSVVGQRFDALGNFRGPAFVVNTYTTGRQYPSDVSSDAAGNFVIVWVSKPGTDGSASSVNGQRYDANGVPQGGEFQVNTSTVASYTIPVAAHAPDGSFVVGFQSTRTDFLGDVVARRYDASGNAIGGELQVNTTTTGSQRFPRFTMDAQGNFVVAWWDSPNDGSGYGVFARRFRADGTPRDAEFVVNTYTTGNQSFGDISSDGAGNFVIAWASTRGITDDGPSVIGQRFGGLHANSMVVDPAGNLVWEPGETVEVRPGWFNANGAAQTFSGTLTDITGPAGATYTITDASGDYGTVADGATAPCADCYEVRVSNPNPRPALHWDASVVESILPDTQGQQKKWLLHVGRSFTDVATASPFYPFIETLLHKGVTGGCGGTSYCPSAATTRDQMSVFVLLAKEGAGYLPPACGTPVFNDVPASSPFCRYLEELARRGVVSGCGGGNYCPSSAVTRDAMAVFVLRTLDPTLNPPACGTPIFNDVPASNPFCKWIEELARRGVVSGCGGGNYCPSAAVTREQMGVFISATFGLTLYGP